MPIKCKEFLESLIDEIYMMSTYEPNEYGGMEPEEWGRYMRRDDIDDMRERIKTFVKNMGN